VSLAVLAAAVVGVLAPRAAAMLAAGAAAVFPVAWLLGRRWVPARADPPAGDEPVRAARAFDAMAERLAQADLQRRRAEDRIRFLAYHDSVTHLPNPLRFRELLHEAVRRARERGRPLAVLAVELTRLRDVRNTFGREFEEDVLRRMAQRLQAVCDRETVLAHCHDSRFLLALPVSGADAATQVAQRILKAMERPFELAYLDLEIDAGIGIALHPLHGDDVTLLERHAHVAVGRAHRDGRGYAFYSPEQDAYNAEQLALVSELRQAIERDELFLAYQPKIDLRDGRVVGVEALTRWRHPALGPIPPDLFIPIAEQTRLIRPLTLWVVESAARQHYAWRRRGATLPIAVNLSARNLLDARLADEVAGRLGAWDVDPWQIEFEITESALMEDPTTARAVMQRLKERGHALAIDDFGMGYSSLGYLKKLPVDSLKIGKSFVIDMLRDGDAAAIVCSTVDLAHNLGLRVVAEGIEGPAHQAHLAGLGCDVGQGFHIGRPLPSDRLLEWCSHRSSPAAAAERAN
jgi:diguanylate cyclase (GGDEF)-like protein